MTDMGASGRLAPEDRRNVILLGMCHATSFSAMSIIITTAGLVGYSLATDKGLATLPIALQLIATMVTTIPASLLMRRYGRRIGFAVGGASAIIAGLLAALAILWQDFALFAAATGLLGVHNGFAVLYRFAAADSTPPAFRSRAIGIVLTGGIVSAVMGPQLATWTRDLWIDRLFLGCYLTIALLGLLVVTLALFLRISEPSVTGAREPPRPLSRIVAQPVFLVAMLSAAVAYGVMTLMMTATPLAMHDHAFSFEQSALVIQGHALAMFAPSFFTGGLVARIGALRTILIGGGILVGCVVTSLSGLQLANFIVGLMLLGLGWNFMFIGATTLATETYTASEKNVAQATNDFVVFSAAAGGALASGYLNNTFGWQGVNWGVLPFILVALTCVTLLLLRPARPHPV